MYNSDNKTCYCPKCKENYPFPIAIDCSTVNHKCGTNARDTTPQEPSLPKKAANFAKAATKHAISGFTNVSKEKKEERLSICQSCEFFLGNNKCSKCGCNMNIKAEWETSSCPIGKW